MRTTQMAWDRALEKQQIDKQIFCKKCKHYRHSYHNVFKTERCLASKIPIKTHYELKFEYREPKIVNAKNDCGRFSPILSFNYWIHRIIKYFS